MTFLDKPFIREIPEGSIEKIIFTSERNYQVPAYLCLPGKPKFSSTEEKQPFFICLQGHSTGMHNSIAVAGSDEITPIEVEGDRDFAMECLRRGIPALCLEQRALCWDVPCWVNGSMQRIAGPL